jgi:putative redox protein
LPLVRPKSRNISGQEVALQKSMVKVTLERKEGDIGFEAKDEQGHLLKTDGSLDAGGTNYGFRPMQLLLVALGSCSAIDMVQILKKQRQQVEAFSMDIEGEREKDVIPSLWQRIAVTFRLQGNIDPEKAERAAALSIEKYCSVAETLRRGGTIITWKTLVNQ